MVFRGLEKSVWRSGVGFRVTFRIPRCRAITKSMVWAIQIWRYKWHIHAGSWSLVNCWREGSTLPYKGVLMNINECGCRPYGWPRPWWWSVYPRDTPTHGSGRISRTLKMKMVSPIMDDNCWQQFLWSFHFIIPSSRLYHLWMIKRKRNRKMFSTRIHSSRMRTAHSSGRRVGGFSTRHPPCPPGTRSPREQAHPQGQTPLGAGTPGPGTPLWTDTHL